MSDNDKKPEDEAGADGDDDHSIEEILASIRRIISDDDAETTEDGDGDAPVQDDVIAKKPEIKEPVITEDEISLDMRDVEDEEDVLELTEAMIEDNDEHITAGDIDAMFGASLEANAEELAEASVVEDAVDSEQEVVVPPIVEEEIIDVDPIVEMRDMEDDNDEDGLLTNEVAAMAAGSLSKLSALDKTETPPSSNVTVGTISLDEIVRQEVRPILKQWLNDNLTGIVERAVEKEISKLKDRL